MDGAAEDVKLVASRILPDRPHHLSLSPTRRYPVPSGFWQHQSRLQYSTFLSDADRGILMTRPYYDIHEEPETAAPNPAAAMPRPDMKKPINKMSFKDYQKQKKFSMSPSENGLSGRTDTRAKDGGDSKSGVGSSRSDGKDKASEAPRDGKVQEPRVQPDGERPKTLPPKPDFRGAPSPASDTRKRAADVEDGARPQKRLRPEDAAPRPENAQGGPHVETPRHRDVDRRANRDAKPAAQSALSNGRAALGILKEDRRAASPKPSVNGVKSHGHGSNSSTPRRTEPQPPKQAVPPLLSPLRLSLDDEPERQEDSRHQKRPTDLSGSAKSSAKAPRPDRDSSTRTKSPVRIPPLLSPTLPPIVEEALARRQVTPQAASSQRGGNLSDSPEAAKKPPSLADGGDSGRRPSYIVKLKYRKKHVKTVQRILALEPASKKGARKLERSVSVETSPPPAKKRPRPPESVVGSSSKRQKGAVAEVAPASKPLAPSTPSKSAIAMSRVASATSQAQTPGDTTGLTPSIPDRPPTSHDSTDQAAGSKAAALRLRHAEFTRLGTKLKHSRDDIIRGRSGGGARGGDPSGFVQLSAADEKRVVALNLEMILAFMIAFKAHSQARHLDHKPWDFMMWEQLQPHFHELKHRTRHIKVLQGLTLQLNAISLEELVMSYVSHEGALSAKSANSLLQASKRRIDTWTTAHEMLSTVSDASMRADMGPWTAVNEAVATALRILRRWVDQERVSWQAEVVLPTVNGA